MIKKKIFLQIAKYCGLFITLTNVMFAQSSPLDFFPVHAGDKWQYRDAAYNDIVFRRFIDSVTTDSNKNTIVWTQAGHGMDLYSQQLKIDSSFNVFNLNSQWNYLQYKLNADSGDSWIGGVGKPNTLDTTIITMLYNAYGVISGKLVKIKVYDIVLHESFGFDLSLERDYLAEGFGLVRMDVEPGAVYMLSGAIINQIHYGEPILKVEENVIQENQFILSQNYPNPFNPTTTIHFLIPHPEHVILKVYDLLGREMATLVNEELDAGEHSVQLNANQLPSGVYIYRLTAGSFMEEKRMLLIK
jgi:hypothetical protein